MEDTGRIQHGLSPSARRIVFGAMADDSIDTELYHVSQVDRAHLVMLAECRIVDRDRVRMLLRTINQLRACHFAPLRGLSAPRGLYLLYEDYLIQSMGPGIGGILQTARSRNDLNATVLRLRLRDSFRQLLREALRLQAILLSRARRFGNAVMPAYTHYQAAVPSTYGHYLVGIAVALGRDIVGIVEAGTDLGRCPLGAGAVGGTSLAIDPARTASLLGFEHPVLHSIDAVASRDLVLRLLANAAILGITLSRLAADLLLWSTAEFGFLKLPDHLVGSSSMMPQKRNPFLLEHVQGRSTSVLGAFMAAASAMHGTPFTNSIAVGTEAVTHVWQALQRITEATTLARLVVAGACPEQQTMLQRATASYTSATELANRLVVEGAMPFRSAHRTVGALIRAAIQKGEESFQDTIVQQLREANPTVALTGLDPISVAQASVHGGGPGAASLDTCLATVRATWSHDMRYMQDQLQTWHAAQAALDDAVQELCLAAD